MVAGLATDVMGQPGRDPAGRAGPAGTGRPRPLTAALLFWTGILALFAEGYALAGRPPDPNSMRGIGPISIAGILASEAVFVAVVVYATVRRGRLASDAAVLALACLTASVAALAIVLRHPLSGAYEFPHREWELDATRTLLLGAALLLAVLWRWQRVRDAADDARGWIAVRRTTRRFLISL
ncbi:MAG: hypothetical protein HY060_11430, partial [Proteobacteria bacterium]|nr:hypothetical protein [Pseudomonadota bacterium]